MPQPTFLYKGRKLEYNRIRKNNFPQSERSVEIPIVSLFLSGIANAGRVLEIGEQLQHYETLLPQRSELQERTIAATVTEVPDTERFDTVVAVSSINAINPALENPDPDESLRAIRKVYNLLADGGCAIITVPMGKFMQLTSFVQFDWKYLNRLFDEFGIPRYDVEMFGMRLLADDPTDPSCRIWREYSVNYPSEAEYNSPYLFANALLILEIHKHENSLLHKEPPADTGHGMSCRACTEREVREPFYRFWNAKMRLPSCYVRKLWEWAAISQCLYEQGILSSGKRGLAFAVGNEPLPALYASYGCEVVATDQDGNDSDAKRDWAETNQLCAGKAMLNSWNLCPPEQFDRLVSFRAVDMNDIPVDLKQGQFDFIWSSCSFEHIGSLYKGLLFVKEAMKCLKPGGLAIHTTEVNCTSDQATVEEPNLVLYRRRDLNFLVDLLRSDGHQIESINYDFGNDPSDIAPMVGFVDHSYPHLKLQIGNFIGTSVILSIRKGM